MNFKLTFDDGSDGYLKHFGVKGMHWGVWNEETRARRMGLSRTPKEYNYKADGKRLAKSGLEQDFATKGTVWYRTASKDFYNPTATSKIRSKQNRKITKNPEIRRLNAEYDTAVKKHGEYSKEATEALAKFQQKGQDLAVRHISKYRNAYLKDLGEKRTRAGKKVLDTALMNEVYLGPATWSNGMNKSYAKALGIPTKIKKSDARAPISKKKEETSKTIKIKDSSTSLSSASSRAFKENPSLTYDKIYKEMKVNTRSEDPDVYRDAEAAWMKKHGYM